MTPNYKRPPYREYIYNRFEEPLTDEDLDMIVYVEGLEKKNEELDSDLYSANQVIHDLADAVEDNERLKKLCDEYEKEHVTTFEIWKKYNHVVDDIRAFLVDRITGYGNVDDLSDEERGFYYGYKRVLYEMERLCDNNEN